MGDVTENVSSATIKSEASKKDDKMDAGKNDVTSTKEGDPQPSTSKGEQDGVGLENVKTNVKDDATVKTRKRPHDEVEDEPKADQEKINNLVAENSRLLEEVAGWKLVARNYHSLYKIQKVRNRYLCDASIIDSEDSTDSD